MKAAAPASLSTADAGQAQRSAMSAIEKDCTTSTGMRCDVVSLYSGEVYNLYKYKKYTDVRLVFAPEFAAAFLAAIPTISLSHATTWTSHSSAFMKTTSRSILITTCNGQKQASKRAS